MKVPYMTTTQVVTVSVLALLPFVSATLQGINETRHANAYLRLHTIPAQMQPQRGLNSEPRLWVTSFTRVATHSVIHSARTVYNASDSFHRGVETDTAAISIQPAASTSKGADATRERAGRGSDHERMSPIGRWVKVQDKRIRHLFKKDPLNVMGLMTVPAHEAVKYNKLDPRLIEQLILIQAHYGNRIVYVTSAYRDPAYNRKVHGARRSQHMSGRAVDIIIPGVSKTELAAYLKTVPGRGGVGIYNMEWVHYDVGSKREWDWRNKKKYKTRNYTKSAKKSKHKAKTTKTVKYKYKNKTKTRIVKYRARPASQNLHALNTRKAYR